MKALFILLFTVVSIVGCSSPEDWLDYHLKGNHELRAFNVKSSNVSEWSVSYFLIAGGGSGKEYIETTVTFAWQANTGEYILSKFPISKIRVKIDDTIEHPYITFNYINGVSSIDDIEWVMDYYVNYIVVHCKGEDYPISINIDQLNH